MNNSEPTGVDENFYLHSFLKGSPSDAYSPTSQSIQPTDLSLPREEHKQGERSREQYLTVTATSAEHSCAADQFARY